MPDKVQTSKLTTTIGVTGLSIWRGVLAEEYLPALKGTRAYKVYQEMADDTVIATLMDSITMPLLAAEFTVDPASEDSKDADNASFIQDCMMNMRRYTWRQHVLDCLSMMTYGWSMSEITLSKRDDGKLGIDILDPRDQNTLQEWKQGDKGQIEGMIQRDPVSGQSFEIPEWKAVHMTFRPKKRNPEGSAPMRSMYRAWYMRKNMEVMEAIGIERDAAGLPVLKLPYGADNASKVEAEAVIKNLRNDEEMGIVLPPPPSSDPQAQKWELSLLGGGSKTYNVRETIRDYNKQLLMRFFAQFLALGMDSAGTQALVKGSHDFFSLALKSIQQEMLEAWNIQLVPLLINVNNLQSPNGYPSINWADPGKADLAGISQFLSTLTSVNIITPDNAIEDQIRAMAGLPERDDTIENNRNAAPVTQQMRRYGGEGSGNWGHEGRPGEVGGSGPGGSIKVVHVESKQLKTWPKERQNLAGMAFDRINKGQREGFVVKDGDTILGVMALTDSDLAASPGMLKVDIIVSKEPGHGKTMMVDAAREAVSRGKGLELHASPQAVGFYKKLGMKGDKFGNFTFTKSQAEKFITGNS